MSTINAFTEIFEAWGMFGLFDSIFPGNINVFKNWFSLAFQTMYFQNM